MTESFNSSKINSHVESLVERKPFLTIDEQINLLKSRGLIMKDERFAKDILEDSNYYRLSGYSLTLRKDDHFFHGVSFEDITDIYYFDQALRSLLFHYLQVIEVRVKSVYAYEFAKMYGPVSYTNPDNFNSRIKGQERMTVQELENLLKKPREMREKRLRDELFLKHYQGVDLLPIWIFIELFTFGDLSRIFAASKDELKIAVSKHFIKNYILRKNYQGTKNVSYLDRNLHCLTTLRNFCAHGSRLFNRVFSTKPSLSKPEREFLRKDNNSPELYYYQSSNPDNSHLYGFIIVMKRLLRDNEFEALKNSIIELEGKYPTVNIGYYGFPTDWESAI